MVGAAEYRKAGSGDFIVVKIETGTPLDYYMNFNRQTGFNSETQEGKDQVTITTQAGEGMEFAASNLVAKLSQGQYFEIANFGGTDLTVRVTVNKIDTSTSPGYAAVTITRTGAYDASILMNCGGGAYNDGTNLWKDDSSFIVGDPGGVYTTDASISDASPILQALYQSERYDSSMKYSIPLPKGRYDVFLHFAEIYFGYPKLRVFDVKLEGIVKFAGIDVVRDAGGPNRARVDSVANFLVSDGVLDIEFVSVLENPKVSV